MEPHGIQALAFSLAWFASWTIGSVVYRRAVGKPILFFNLDSPRFLERGASGHSNDNLLRRLGGASNVLVVGVVQDRFIVRPFFPFNLLFLPEIYGLEHDMATTRVRRVDVGRFLFWRRAIITFDDDPGRSRSMTLYLKDPDGLAQLLRPTQAAAELG